MTIRRFYELSLSVPLVVLMLIALASFIDGLDRFEPAYRSPRYGMALPAVSYLGLVYFARRRMRRMSEPDMVKVSLRAAFLFAGLACLCFLPILGSAFTEGSSLLELGRNLQGVGLVLVGAAEYVLLVNGVLFVCYLARLVRHERAGVFL